MHVVWTENPEIAKQRDCKFQNAQPRNVVTEPFVRLRIITVRGKFQSRLESHFKISRMYLHSLNVFSDQQLILLFAAIFVTQFIWAM